MCVFLASDYEWVTVMHEIPISSAQLMTSFHTLGLSSTTPLVPLERGLFHMRRFQQACSIVVMGLHGSCWWAAPQPRLLPCPSAQESRKEGRHVSALHPQLGTALKNGVIQKLVS